MMGIGFGMFGLLLMLLFWVGLIVLAVWLVKALFPRDSQSSVSADDRDLKTRQILDQRYARGEIAREQYELMKQDLG